jgi:very-short-patch-repair endonuclease
MALRYGDETATRMFALKNEKCSITRAKLEAKFGVNNADQIIRSRGASLSNYVKRHGEEIGTQKWATYLAKRAAAYARRHEEGYEFARYTEDYYIGLYGEERGKEVFADRIRKQRYKVSRQRYIDEYGIGLGEDICRRVKTNTSRSAFIERYGETEGLARFNACVDKREQSRTYSHSSRAADSFFSLLVEILGLDRNECAFGEGAEKFFFLTEEERHVLPQRVIAVDFVLGHKVIEYHGDMVHANPRLCSADDRPHPWDKELTAQEIWDRDHARHQILRGRGYDVLVVWEDEAIQPDTFEICKTFLKGESCKTRL